MSYVVMATYLEETDIAAGFYADGSPKNVLRRTAGAVFTPQGGNAAQVTKWANAGLVKASASLPAYAGTNQITPAHAVVHAQTALNGTLLDQVTSVTMKLTGGDASLPQTACQIRSAAPSQIVIVVPKLPPGGYTVTLWLGAYSLGTATFTLDSAPN